MKIVSFCLICFMPILLLSQVNKRLALGFDAGFGVYTSTLCLDYNFLNHFAVSAQLASGLYQGFGFGPAITYYALPKNDFRPFLGITYYRSFGTYISYENLNAPSTVYKTKDANYLLPYIGGRINDLGENRLLGISVSAFAKIGYKVPVLIYPGIKLYSGQPNQTKYDKINNNINMGLFGSVGLIFNFIEKG
jgi:hypothetical protein